MATPICVPCPALPRCAIGLAPFEQHGLIAWNGSHVSIAADAVPYARAIVATLDPYRGHSAARFSNAV